jgi:3-keto-5-aminohexanoate cleavage enzyme
MTTETVMKEWAKDYEGYVKARFKKFPIELEPRINTMDKKLIIECATTGPSVRYWGPRDMYPKEPVGYKEGGIRFAAVPCTIEEQANSIIDAVKAGAAAIHHHAVDPDKGYRTKASYAPELQAEIFDRVFKVVDMVTLQDTFDRMGAHADWIKKTKNLLATGGGNKYCQGSVVLVGFGKFDPEDFHISEQSLVEGVPYLEANDVKPIYQLYNPMSLTRLKAVLIDSGLSKQKPYVLNLHMGKHDAYVIDKDPWATLQLISTFHMVKETIPESVMGFYAGGRNWLPLTVQAIMLGADIIRVGIEDCYWTYPHRDDVIPSNAEVVRKIATIAKELGREIATPEEARKILGIKLTSPRVKTERVAQAA